MTGWRLVSEVAHVAGFGVELSGCLVGVDGGWWDEPVLAFVVAFDVPAVVVNEEVVRFAQQDAVGDVGFAVLGRPFVDVVCFGPGHFGVASFDRASTPFDGEGGALLCGEESLFTSDVQGQQVLDRKSVV